MLIEAQVGVRPGEGWRDGDGGGEDRGGPGRMEGVWVKSKASKSQLTHSNSREVEVSLYRESIAR